MEQTHTKVKFSELLSQNKISQRRLSALVGISPALLTMMLKGERTFQFRHRDNISRIFNVQEDSIIWHE
jgi:transcriptional regulator with XRE-family HTH domain